MPRRFATKSHSAFIGFLTVVLIVTVLYLGKNFIMPLALAALLAFMLGPLVRLLCHWNLPRTLAVVIVTVFTFSALAFVGWLLGQQAAMLAEELPNYQQNINKRIASIQNFGEQGFIQKMRQFGESLSSDVLGSAPAPANPDQPAPPQPQGEGLASKALNTMLSGLANGLGTASVIILIVIFLLLRQEDTSQRIVRLAGFSRLTTTTRALDEVGDRVSHYLLMQGTINGLYGLMLSGALALVGLPYVILWGVLAAIFRYIPYIGPIIVAVLPVGFSLAYFDGWTQPLIVIGVIMALELCTNMILEPVLYGKSTGVSDLAIIIAITFWTWLWGGIGLVLATPLTVVLVVFAKYIPSLQWIDILMGDKPKPQPHLSYYQQLISDDHEITHSTIEESIEDKGLPETMESIVLPALSLTRRETLLGKLTHEEQTEVHDKLERTLKLIEAENEATNAATNITVSETTPSHPVTIFARALHGSDDALALRSLAILLPSTIELEISQEPHLIGELIHRIETHKPDLICISAMPPDASASAIILCRRFRNRLPNLKILVCRWALPDDELDDRAIREAGATWVATSVSKAAEIIQRFAEG
ncbi:AI-2E family transporter [Phragmitibacter flavus]|uniref:AI-2E family transporter n=1 Tax=Phragmitibacter flavus TaxID=2576071 RepID=A0A5R8KG32_9BACT|nr:AI-2E family transporter [Phragmitibacter flavus]TLD71262.1 AI-2E family transporter [Phragmitibacter flavus]